MDATVKKNMKCIMRSKLQNPFGPPIDSVDDLNSFNT